LAARVVESLEHAESLRLNAKADSHQAGRRGRGRMSD
jgi:hypothetical protein